MMMMITQWKQRTCLAHSSCVDVITALSKRIYILIIKVNKFFFPFFMSQCFLKEIEKYHVLCVSIEL